MVVSLRNGSKSTLHPLRSPKPRVITNVGPFKSSTSRRNRRPCAARHRLLVKLLPPHRHNRVSKTKVRPKSHLLTGTILQPVPNKAGLLQLERLRRLVLDKNLNGQFLTTQLLEMHLSVLLLVPQQGVHSVEAQGCLQEGLRTDSRLRRLLLRRMPKAASHSQRASSTRYQHLTLNLSRLVRLIRALGSQVRNECSRSSLDHLAHIQRVATDGRTLLLRP